MRLFLGGWAAGLGEYEEHDITMLFGEESEADARLGRFRLDAVYLGAESSPFFCRSSLETGRIIFIQS